MLAERIPYLMSQFLNFPRPRPRKATTVQPLLLPHLEVMTLGDVLYRLALVDPIAYKHLDGLARYAFQRAWPIETDPLSVIRAKSR
jgi:hypothetical protein